MTTFLASILASRCPAPVFVLHPSSVPAEVSKARMLKAAAVVAQNGHQKLASHLWLASQTGSLQVGVRLANANDKGPSQRVRFRGRRVQRHTFSSSDLQLVVEQINRNQKLKKVVHMPNRPPLE